MADKRELEIRRALQAGGLATGEELRLRRELQEMAPLQVQAAAPLPADAPAIPQLEGGPPIPEPRGIPQTRGERLKEAVRPAAEFGLATMEGATLNLADEIGAVSQTALGQLGVEGFSPEFAENLATSRRTLKQIPAGRRLAGNIVGGVGTGIATGVAAGATTIPRIAALAAAEGGIAGAGAGENPLQQVGGAALGGATGALFGFLVPTTVTGITRLVNRVRGGMTRAEQKAANKIVQNLRRDQIPLEDAVAQLRAIEGSTLADLPFARNTLGLARAVESSPGEGAAALTRSLAGRQIGRADRVRDAIRGLISPRNFGETQQQLITNRREVANRLFGIARQRGVISSGELNRILDLPGLRPILRQVQQNLVSRSTGEPLSRLPRNNIEVLDEVYKELGQRSFAKGGDVRGGVTGQIANRIRVQLRDELRELAPEYALALERFSGNRALEEALDAGRTAFRGQDADLLTENFVRNLTESEREVFLAGLARQASEAIDAGANPVSAVRRLQAPKVRRVIEAATGSRDRANEFVNILERELQFARTERAVIGGSPTSRIDAERADAAAGSLEVALDLARGDAAGATRGALSELTQAFRGGRPAGQLAPDVSEALGRMLSVPDQPATGGAQTLQGALNREQAALRLRALLALGATAGSTTGGAQILQPGADARLQALSQALSAQ